MDGKANIFGAGHDAPPAPAGGGAGVLPAMVELPAGDSRDLAIACVAGSVHCCWGETAYWGAEGQLSGTTDIESHQGISGIKVAGNGMFLAGVFLTDDPPRDPAPGRIECTEPACPTPTNLQIGQTFFIGKGVDSGSPAVFEVPAAATRFFLGFVDGFQYKGKPGWYDNNRGELQVAVRVAVD